MLAGLLILASCSRSPGGPSPSPTPSPSETATTTAALSPSPAEEFRLIKVTISGTDIQTESDVIEVPTGKKIRIEVTIDRTDELHVHGYDHTKDLVAGQVNVLEFVADIPGGFEVELERSHKKLFELRVT